MGQSSEVLLHRPHACLWLLGWQEGPVLTPRHPIGVAHLPGLGASRPAASLLALGRLQGRHCRE